MTWHWPVVFLTVAVSNRVLAQTTLKADCYDSDNFLVCSANQFKSADIQLNKVYKALLKRIDGMIGTLKTASVLKHQVIEAQQEWVKTRDDTCKAVTIFNRPPAKVKLSRGAWRCGGRRGG